jgi:hypothetical protein
MKGFRTAEKHTPFFHTPPLFALVLCLTALSGCPLDDDDDKSQGSGEVSVISPTGLTRISPAAAASKVSVTLENSKKYTLRVSLADTGQIPDRVTISAAGPTAANKVTITIGGALEGDVFNLALEAEVAGTGQIFNDLQIPPIYCFPDIPDNGSTIQMFSVISGPAAYSGMVDEAAKTVTIRAPHGTERTAMFPYIIYKGKSITPASGTPQDFTNPVTYTVTAANGSKQAYTVTVIVVSQAESSAKAITAFSLTSPVTATGLVDEAAKTVTINVPYGTKRTAMIPAITHTGAGITPAPGKPQDFSDASPVIYTVTAPDGSSQDYAVTVLPQGQGSISVTFNGPQDDAITVTGAPSGTVRWLTDGDLNGNLILSVQNPAKFPGATYQWYKDGNALTDNANITGAATSKLTISVQDEFTLAPHTLIIQIITPDGVIYSKTINFKVG